MYFSFSISLFYHILQVLISFACFLIKSYNLSVSVQSLSRIQFCVTPWTAACQASLSITNSWSLIKLTSIELVIPSNHLILCCPLFLPYFRLFFVTTTISYTHLEVIHSIFIPLLIFMEFIAYSVQFSCSVMSDSLWPLESQHTRPPCPSPTPEFTQIHVHWVGDAIEPSHPLSSASPPDLNLSQHQSLFQWVSSLHQVAKVLEFQLQHQSFQ